MLKPLVRGALPVMLASACGLPFAHADIYTWTDESGRANISNLAPPEGARVTKVVHEMAGKPVARDEAREALREAEVRALADRVRQLQNEVELAKRAPPPVEYRAVQPAPVTPPIIQYITLEAPQYPSAAPQPAYAGCNSGWPDCTLGWYPGFYPVSYPVYVGFPRERHFRRDNPVPTPHSRGPVAPWSPIPVSGSGRGR